jgi:hypothetical protein
VSAARGAFAGLMGGAALAVTHRMLLPKLPDRKRSRIDRWDARVDDVGERLGVDLSARSRTAIGVSSQLVVATLLGATYAVVVEQQRPSRALQKLLDAGLVYAASFVAPDLAERKLPRKRRNRRVRLQRRALERVNAPTIFGRATSLALKTLPH